LAYVVKEVLAFPGILVLRLLPFAGKPVGAFPTKFGAKNSSLLFEGFIQRATPYTACTFQFFAGPVDVIIFTVTLYCAIMQKFLASVQGTKAPDVEESEGLRY